MAIIYDRFPVTIYASANGLSIRKTQEADAKVCPHLIFSHLQAQALWDTLVGSGQSVAGAGLALYGTEKNAKGTFFEQLAAAHQTEKRSEKTGEPYMRNDTWEHSQLIKFKPALVQLELNFKSPQLRAYLVPPEARASGGKVRVIPDIKRIDPASPEGKAIAAKATAPIKRVG